MTVTVRIATLAALIAAPLAAHPIDPLQEAIDSGVCGDAGVAEAIYDEATNTIKVTCNEDVVGFVPLLGGLGPALAAGGAAALLAAAAGGGATSDTQ